MNKISRSLVPWEVSTHPDSNKIDYTDVEAFLDGFKEVDVFAFMGVPDHSRERYMEESLEILLELDEARKVFAPEAYRDFLEDELRGLKVRYHSPDSRREELQNIEEQTNDRVNMIAPTMDYTVPRTYSEASTIFEDVETPQDNILLDFDEFRQTDGSLRSYLMTDIESIRGDENNDRETSYTVNDSDVIFPGISYSENSGDYFGLNFFSPGSEAVRVIFPQSIKDFAKELKDFSY